MSVYDIDAFLVQRNFIKPGELISATPAKYPRLVKKYPFLEGKKSFEGFVYPDTHRIRQGADLEEFLYYLHDPDGGIHYAKTNEEHNSNKRKYLK